MINSKIKILRDKSATLPETPGVYIMKDSNKEIIYIGKAKSLKQRVKQYFRSEKSHTEKVIKMVSNIDDFEYILTDNEFEALVLECNLIKLHYPKYNILLKDDKGYYYIKITNNKWPHIVSCTRKTDDGCKYLGPYTSSWSTKKAVEETLKIFKLPTCGRDFSKGKTRPCLNFYINQCVAPCNQKIKYEDYKKLVKDAMNFLVNGRGKTLKELKSKMEKESENLNFEKAAELRDKIKLIEKMGDRQKVVSIKVKEQDIISLAWNKKSICIEIFHFMSGNLCEAENFIIDYDEDLDSVRAEFIERYYSMNKNIPPIIAIDSDIENKEIICKWLSLKSKKTVQITSPKSGEQYKLIEMCKNNAFEILSKSSDNIDNISTAIEQLEDVLCLKNPPEYIEAYDISNLQGSNNVGGMVVFKNGIPCKSLYKRFKIKSVIGQDDYLSMKEVITRRMGEYEKSISKSKDGFARLPDLILIDGGKGHISAVKDVINRGDINVPIFGMVKDSHHKTRALVSEASEINISRYRQLFILITQIQDEVHRFTIQYHRKKRENGINKNSILFKINGVGAKRVKVLLKRFGTIERLSRASAEEIKLIPGITKALSQEIYNYFHS